MHKDQGCICSLRHWRSHASLLTLPSSLILEKLAWTDSWTLQYLQSGLCVKTGLGRQNGLRPSLSANAYTLQIFID